MKIEIPAWASIPSKYTLCFVFLCEKYHEVIALAPPTLPRQHKATFI